jgi:hypothetical protein
MFLDEPSHPGAQKEGQDKNPKEPKGLPSARPGARAAAHCPLGNGRNRPKNAEDIQGSHLFVLPPRSPKLNGHVERAHRTHTEESRLLAGRSVR